MSISSLCFILICYLSLLHTCFSIRVVVNSFQTKTFSLLSKKHLETNIIFSPLSLYQSLSLISNGARGKTEYEIIFALDNKNQVDQNIYNFKLLNKNRTSLLLANAVLSKYPPSDLYLQMAHRFKAFISELTSADQINQWCKNKTNGTINEIITDIANIELIILNAVYFNGKWKHTFESYNTYNSTFSNINNTQIHVKMMKQTNIFNYYEDSIAQVVESEYKEDNFTAVIIIPNEKCNINDYIEKNFNETTLKNYFNNMIQQEIEFHLPKFKVESYLDLNKTLQEIGIKRAFNSTTADFGIFTPHRNLSISTVVQKTFMKVDEEGTEAAAVTAIVCDGLGREVEKKVIVNRPFLFIIRDKDFGKNHPFIAKIVNLTNE